MLFLLTGALCLLAAADESPALQGFPGAVDVRVVYTLTGDNRVIVEIEATADAVTPVDIAPAPAFNLDGAGAGDVLEHMAQVQACAHTRRAPQACHDTFNGL